jgi:hypothetical protein
MQNSKQITTGTAASSAHTCCSAAVKPSQRCVTADRSTTAAPPPPASEPDRDAAAAEDAEAASWRSRRFFSSTRWRSCAQVALRIRKITERVIDAFETSVHSKAGFAEDA